MKTCTLLLSILSGAVMVFAQVPASQPVVATDQPAATQPAGEVQVLEATVVKVERDVTCAQVGPDGKPGPFKPVKVGDRLPAGTIVRTGLRSKVMLTFGDDTIVLIERVTLASIDQFYHAGDTRKLQLGVGRGMIRATTVETTLRSDMTIACPAATLSKRGTQDFGLRYEAGTGHYTIWLNQEGLVHAFDWLRNTGRDVQPGQYVTQALMRWIETLTLDRYVPVVDAWGTTDAERWFDAHFAGTGFGVVNPGGGSTNYSANFSASNSTAGHSGPSFNNPAGLPSIGINDGTPGGVLTPYRPEGNFGTGFGR